ncbi:MAG: sensor histidine kinase [Bacteroidales bacterium]|nr:sensor histidine kinase [Bacteroidales bacterium]
MRSSSPRELALYIAILATSMFGGTIFILNFFQTDKLWVLIILAVVVFFILIYLIIFQIFNNFIFEKIQPIYKSIHEHSLSQKELKKRIEKKDMISAVNKEVEDWANTKTHEIKKLKQIEKYRKDFLGNVSHELKTPIFNIQGYILTLLEGGLEDNKINKLYLKRTEKSINRMISIVEDLESISRLESGELKLSIEKFNILKLTEEVLEALEIRANQHNISLNLGSGYNKAIYVLGDRKRILEVLNNLLVNSISYGKEKGKTTVSFMDMGQNILVDVTDTGIGISEKDIPRIFERFFRSDKSRSRDEGGTGLGLSIAKHVIEAHHQTINVRSKLGKGSSFVFTLKKA